jgi:uncharacterized membrane protein YdjX (TVP38/TMEM64 family)
VQALVGITLAAWALVEAIEAVGGAEAIRASWGASAGWVTVPVQAVVSASPVPGEIIAFLNTALYGFWIGAALSWCGWMGAAFIEYALVRRLGREFAGDGGRERLPQWLRTLPYGHPAFLIFARYLPFGAHVVNSTAALHGVPPGRLAWTAAVSLVPSSLLFSAFAAGLLSLG